MCNWPFFALKADEDPNVYSYLIEEAILAAFEGRNLKCPTHGDLYLGQLAPDTVFLDLDDRLRVPNESVKRGSLIGRGAFGFVYQAVCRQRGNPTPKNVAVKMLQPIHPGLVTDPTSSVNYFLITIMESYDMTLSPYIRIVDEKR